MCVCPLDAAALLQAPSNHTDLELNAIEDCPCHNSGLESVTHGSSTCSSRSGRPPTFYLTASAAASAATVASAAADRAAGQGLQGAELRHNILYYRMLDVRRTAGVVD